MTELSREQILDISNRWEDPSVLETESLCRMALRAHDAEQRAQRAEAENEKLRGYLQTIIEDPETYGDAAFQHAQGSFIDLEESTPPPEGEPQSSGIDNLLDEMAADIDSMSDEEIRAESSPGDAEEMRRVIESATAPHAPEQAHGDALAALDRILLRGDNAKCGDFQIVRNALTASGVPGHWACKNPGRADQYRAEAMACRRALGFDAESHDVSPTDLTSAIADSGVPYIPEEVRRLPEEWRTRFQPDVYPSMTCREVGVRFAIELERALASAPAVPKFPAGWKVNRAEQNRITIQHPKIGFAVLTNESDDNPRVTIAYELIDDMIAAAPTDGRE